MHVFNIATTTLLKGNEWIGGEDVNEIWVDRGVNHDRQMKQSLTQNLTVYILPAIHTTLSVHPKVACYVLTSKEASIVAMGYV